MNTFELADELRERWQYAEISECMLKAANLLEQQQERIEELEKQLDEAEQRYWNNK